MCAVRRYQPALLGARRVWMCVSVYMHMYSCVYLYIKHIHVYMYISICVYMYLRIYVLMSVYTTCTHAHTHARARTHTGVGCTQSGAGHPRVKGCHVRDLGQQAARSVSAQTQARPLPAPPVPRSPGACICMHVCIFVHRYADVYVYI